MPPTIASPTVTFALVDVAAEWDTLQSLASLHYHELAHWPDLPFSPDKERYLAIDAAGMLRVFGAWHGLMLIGYSSYVVAPSLHQSYSLQARHDALYLLPEYRNLGNGCRLIRHCDSALAAEGVQTVFMSSHIRQPIDPVLSRCGYEPIDSDWGKRLDRLNPGSA